MNILLVIIDVRVSNSLCLICLKRKGDANFNLRETKVLLEFIPIKASSCCSPHFYSLYLFSYMFRASILSRQFHTSRSVLRTGPLTPLTTEKLSSLQRSSKFKQASPYCSSDTLRHLTNASAGYSLNNATLTFSDRFFLPTMSFTTLKAIQQSLA